MILRSITSVDSIGTEIGITTVEKVDESLIY